MLTGLAFMPSELDRNTVPRLLLHMDERRVVAARDMAKVLCRNAIGKEATERLGLLVHRHCWLGPESLDGTLLSWHIGSAGGLSSSPLVEVDDPAYSQAQHDSHATIAT